MHALLALVVAWQAPHTPAQREMMAQANLVRRAEALSARQFDGIDGLAAWQRQRPEIRRRFLDMLGLDPLPARTPMRVRITGGLPGDRYRVENIVFESQPGLYVTGNLYLPAGGGRFPAVVYVCGHSPHPLGAKVNYQHHGIWFARHGMAAFVLDTLEFGEIAGIHHGVHDLEMWHWLSLGYNPAGVEVWNAIRALDYLETRPEIDRTRVAITGRSGGGAVSWFTAAADERFQVAVPVHGTWSIGPHVAGGVVKENCDCIYYWNTWQLDLPAVGALIAPRPLMIVNATQDDAFPPSGYRPVEEALRRVYGWYGAGEKLAAFEAATGHVDTPPYRQAANEWINRWLRNDRTPAPEESLPLLAPEKLRALDAYPPDARNEGIHRSFIPLPALAAPLTLEAWRTRKVWLRGAFRLKTFAAFPKTEGPLGIWRTKDSGWASRYTDAWRLEFSTEEDVRVAGRLFVPRDGRASHPALIYAKGREDIVYGVDFDNLLSAFPHHVVLVLQPRFTDAAMDNYKLANTKMAAALLGTTLETLQLWDILQAVRLVATTEKIDSLTLYARRHMGGLALHAAALDGRITRVVLDDPPVSHWQGPPLLNVLRLTDLPEVAGMIAPREIVTLGAWPAAYRLTQSIYALHGARAKLREAHSLAQALEVWRTPQ